MRTAPPTRPHVARCVAEERSRAATRVSSGAAGASSVGLASAGAAHRIARRLRALGGRCPTCGKRAQERAALRVLGWVWLDCARVVGAASRRRVVRRDPALLHVVRLRKLLPLLGGMGGSFRSECKFCRESTNRGPFCGLVARAA